MSERLSRKRGSVTIATDGYPFPLDCGATLAYVEIAFETYGVLNAQRNNVVLICHALTGSAHVAGIDDDGTRGWWDALIGAGRAIDTTRYFVICTNILGGCYGSTGPTSRDPATGAAYGATFPTITVRDMVRAQRAVIDRLGVERLHAVIGGSMGGMQVLEWAVLYPDLVERIIPIATSAQHSPWCIGYNAIAREAIDLGRAAGDDAAGLRLARKVAMMTYRSGVEFGDRFARDRVHEAVDPVEGTFDVERYLERHGHKLAARFDGDTYRTITCAMDLHDLAWQRDDIRTVLNGIMQPALCVGISTDILYPAYEQRQLAHELRNAEYHEIESPCGHDAFLIECDQLGAIIAPFLERTEQTSLNTTYNEIHA